MIEARDLTRVFTRTQRVEGRFSTVRTLLTRNQVSTTAVRGVSFSVDEGEIIGYLGPNGAGKSTTIKMLTGILLPSSGTATVAGLVPWLQRERNAMNIGAVFGQRSQLWWDLPLDESFKLIGRMYRVESDRYRKTMSMLTELLDMEEFLATPVRQLSLGQRMRGDLAAAMIYEPRVLFLDEPTVGLDLIARERVRGFIEEINRHRKTTVLLTTHDLDDVERLCNRILIIDRGEVTFDGLTADLRRQFAPYRMLEIVIASGDDAPEARLQAGLPPGVTIDSQDELKFTLQVNPSLIPMADAIARVAQTVPVADLTVREAELESIIRRLYESRGQLQA